MAFDANAIIQTLSVAGKAAGPEFESPTSGRSVRRECRINLTWPRGDTLRPTVTQGEGVGVCVCVCDDAGTYTRTANPRDHIPEPPPDVPVSCTTFSGSGRVEHCRVKKGPGEGRGVAKEGEEKKSKYRQVAD